MFTEGGLNPRAKILLRRRLNWQNIQFPAILDLTEPLDQW